MAAKGCCPANFDRAHDTAFGAAEMAFMCLTIRFAVMAKDIRHLKF
jgi:hypothetical protein